MNKREVQKLKYGECVFVCTSRHYIHNGERPGFIAFVLRVTVNGGVLVEHCGTRSWHQYSVVYRQELHHRDRHLRPKWVQQIDEGIPFAKSA